MTKEQKALEHLLDWLDEKENRVRCCLVLDCVTSALDGMLTCEQHSEQESQTQKEYYEALANKVYKQK